MEVIKKENGLLNIDMMIKNAMKEKDKIVVTTLRNVKTRIMEFMTQEVKQGAERPVYDVKAENALLEKMSKELKKDVDTYLSINTAKSIENASESQNQLNVITDLLPTPATEEEILEGITDWVVKYGAIESKQIGMVIRHVMTGHPNTNKADVAKLINKTIKGNH